MDLNRLTPWTLYLLDNIDDGNIDGSLRHTSPDISYMVGIGVGAVSCVSSS